MRVFALLLFVCGVNFTPVHLALENHLEDLLTPFDHTEDRPAGLAATGPEESSPHAPHLASDHSLRLASQARVSFVSFDLCPAIGSLQVHYSSPRLPLFLTERQNPPGLPPPEPFRPRGPPLA